MSTGAIRKELMEVAKLQPKRNEEENQFLIRLQKAISEDISEDDWNSLSPEAQDWNNQAADDITEKRPMKGFADEVHEPAQTSSRRRGAASSTPAATAFTPKLGDNVLVTTKRGKTVQGIIVDLTDSDVVLNADGDAGDNANDVEIPLDGASIVASNTAEALELENKAMQAGAAAVDDPAKIPPEIGDTIKVETARGKTVMGKITELDGDELVLQDSTGEEHELRVSKLKSFEIKVRAAGNGKAEVSKVSDAPATRRGTGVTGGGAPAGSEVGEKPKRSSNEPGVSPGRRIRELLVEDSQLTDEQIGKALMKEKIEAREQSIKMIAKDTRYILHLLGYKVAEEGATKPTSEKTTAAEKAKPATTGRRGAK